MTNIYDFVGDKIIEFCDKTYYADIVCSFEQSYDGKEWTKEVEFASFENGTDLYYENDWNEGQTHIQNLRIWHLEDSEPIVLCKNCKWYLASNEKCGLIDTRLQFYTADKQWTENSYCCWGERKERTVIW